MRGRIRYGRRLQRAASDPQTRRQRTLSAGAGTPRSVELRKLPGCPQRPLMRGYEARDMSTADHSRVRLRSRRPARREACRWGAPSADILDRLYTVLRDGDGAWSLYV